MFKKRGAVTMGLVLIVASVGGAVVHADPANKVGMWYSTLYSNEGEYIWQKGHGVDSTDKFLGDINGDGKDDAVFFYDSGGVWHTLLSNGSTFTFSGNWAQGHGQGSSKRFLADVNGDNCADAVAYWQAEGNWRAWPSNCTNGFVGDNTIRIAGHGVGSADQLMGDVNGDNRADAVIVTNQGDWHAATSGGYWLQYAGLWKKGHGAGAQFKRYLSNVNSDTLDDAVVFDSNTSHWYVSTNNGLLGEAQELHGLWRAGYGTGSTNQLLARADNNASYDIAVYHTQAADKGAWYISESNDTSFNSDPRTGTPRIIWHGNAPKLEVFSKGASSWQGIGDLNGDGVDEAIVFHNRGSEGQPLGEWRVLTLRENDADIATPGYWNAKYTNPDQFNYWQANLISHIPIVNGIGQQYDSGNTPVIDSHLAKIDQADVDYLLFDLTNGVGMPFVLSRAQAVCARIANYNQVHGTSLKFAIAQGSVQSSPGATGVDRVETEAGEVQALFVNDPVCGPHYFNWQNKPFLVTMFNSVEQVKAWEQYTNKSHSPNFTMRYTLGSVPWIAQAQEYPSTNGNGCGTAPSNVQPWPAEWGYYAGWGMPWGSLANSSLMVAMPGWYVHASANDAHNKRVSRTQFGVEGRFYSECGWDRIISNDPDMAVINSFNEFAEETAVEPSDTSQLQGLSQPWSHPDFYWNMTRDYITTYKN